MIIESVCRISSESLISVDGNASWATVTRTAVDPAPSSSTSRHSNDFNLALDITAWANLKPDRRRGGLTQAAEPSDAESVMLEDSEVVT